MTCPICRAEDKPSFVAWELGFVAGYLLATSTEDHRAFVAAICDRHATSLARILANRAPKGAIRG